MFQSGMTAADARAELVRLKQEVWPHGMALLDAIVPRPASDAPELQSDWLDESGVGCLWGEAGIVYCRTVLGPPGPNLIGMIGLRADRLTLPQVWERGHWDPEPSMAEPPIRRFRNWAWGKSDRMELLRTHLPLCRSMSYGHDGMGQGLAHDLVPRAAVLEQLYRPKPGLVAEARFGFRVGNMVVHFADPEHPFRLRLAPKFAEQARIEGLDFSATERFREDFAALQGITLHPCVARLVPEGEGIPELRARVAGR